MSLSFKSIILLILFGLFCSYQSFSQSPIFKHFTTIEGLASTEVYQVIQDRYGYIWFATNVGVSRYDGYKFKNFTSDDGLPDNTVLELYEDAVGRIWFIPITSRLSYFQNDTIYQYKYNDLLTAELTASNIPLKLSFRANQDGAVSLCIYKRGKFLIDKSGNLSFEGDTISSENIYLDDERPYVALTNGGKNRLSSVFDKGKLAYIINTETLPKPVMSTGRCLLLENDNGNLLYAKANFIIEFEGPNAIGIKEFANSIIWTSKKRNGDLCVGTYKGCYMFHGSSIGKEPYAVYLPNNSISSVMEDTEGGLWFTSLDNGVFYLPSEAFISYTVSDGLTSNIVNSVFEGPDSTLWLCGNSSSISVIGRDGNKTYDISDNNVWVVYCGLYNKKENKLWIGSGASTLAIDYDDMLSGKFNKAKKVISLVTNRMIQGSDDVIWLGTSFSAIKVVNTEAVYSSRDDLIDMRIHSIYEDEKKNLWMGTLKGLYQYEGGQYYYHGEKNKLLTNRINAIEKTGIKDALWLGTKEKGILLYDYVRDSVLLSITAKSGLIANSVTSLLVDGNTVWSATNMGLSRIQINPEDYSKYTIQNYNSHNGLVSNEVNHLFLYDKMIYASTNGGITFFPANFKEDTSFIPPVYITRIQISGKDTSLRQGFVLDHYENNIAISFVGLSYKNREKIIYYYRLNPQESWKSTINTQVLLPFLPPGEYNFMVSTDPYGSNLANRALVSFQILNPYWKKWWFYLAVILFTVMLVSGVWYFINRFRIKEINKRNTLVADLIQYRQQALRQQMNPHFIFNTLSSLQFFILSNDTASSNKYLTMFSRLMRMTLDNSQYNSIPIRDDLETLNLYMQLETLRFKNKFEFSIVVPDERIYEMKIPTLLIQPYVENAIRHGLLNKIEKGILCVTLEFHKNDILCTIEDNGIGRKKALEIRSLNSSAHKPLGTKITETRLKLISSLYGNEMKLLYEDLQDSDGNACGTKVYITLPIIN